MPRQINTAEAFGRVGCAERVMQLDAYPVVAPEPEEGGIHTHIAIAWRGGVLWLDMSEQHDHFSVDVRNFVPADQVNPDAPKVDDSNLQKQYSDEDVVLAGTGVFTIVNGRRQTLSSGTTVEDNETGELRVDKTALADPDGTPVLGHAWNGGYVVTLMHDKEPSKNQTNRHAGSGRG